MPQDTYHDCTIETDTGTAEGYVCGLADENWRVYLSEIGVRTEVEEAIAAADVERVAILRNMDVDEDDRGQSHGTRLLRDMLAAFEEHDAGVVILFADLHEANDFDLEAWYARNGFERVDRDAESPFMMIADEEIVAAVRRATGYENEAPSPD